MRQPEIRCDVFSMEQLLELVDAPLPVDGRVGAEPRAARTFFRDLHLDTPDESLRARGISCRLRIGANDRRRLLLDVADRRDGARASVEHHESRVGSAEVSDAVREATAVGRRLRAFVDPARLRVRADLEIERYVRVARRDWLGRPRMVLLFEQVTVRHGTSARSFQQIRIRARRASPRDVEALARAYEQRHGLRRSTADTRTRADLLLKWMEAEGGLATLSRDWPVSALVPPRTAIDGATEVQPLLNSEISLLEFNVRVLAMAEERTAPVGERLRFLAIVSSNLDEFFAVRVAGLRDATRELAEEQGEQDLSRQAQLALVSSRAAALVARQYRCHRDCITALAAAGVRVRAWTELDASQREGLRAYFREEIYPALTPLAMTLAPGHPFPTPPHLSLSLAVVLLDRHGAAPRLACVELPRDVPRVVEVPGSPDAILVEEIVRANLDVLYPHASVEQAYAYRATRGADLALDEDADDLRQAVDEARRQRGANAVVRVEVERAMPLVIRDLVLAELRAESPPGALPLSHADLYEIDGPLDLRHLTALPVPAAERCRDLEIPGESADSEPLWAAIREHDLLFHHPFDPFAETVERVFRDAARDPDVVSVKTTLYRTGDDSPIVEALRDAAAAGKQVAAFVELKARFEEERNVASTRAIEEAGGRVVYGLVGLKNHAKVTLIARREGGRLRRYVHVGTGNYNAVTARQYTDLSLFSADERLAEEVSRFFNDLTGTSHPPERLAHGALVAPTQLLPAILERIDREAEHARAGRPAGIRLKLNGLSHPEVIRALYRASQAGVSVDLVVRGVCTLRPSVPGLSDRIRVVAIVGRLLEHSRIYHFTNGGDAEYLIGSSDLRPRNLRRRIELLVPVRDARGRALLDRLLDLYLDDPAGWELLPSGEYARRHGEGPSTQERLLREAAARGVSAPGTGPRSHAAPRADHR